MRGGLSIRVGGRSRRSALAHDHGADVRDQEGDDAADDQKQRDGMDPEDSRRSIRSLHECTARHVCLLFNAPQCASLHLIKLLLYKKTRTAPA